MATRLTPSQRKQTAAYYTNRWAAPYLVDAVVSQKDRVLERYFGDGVFVDAWPQHTAVTTPPLCSETQSLGSTRKQERRHPHAPYHVETV